VKKKVTSKTDLLEKPGTSALPDDVLLFDEALKFLGTSRPTLYRLLKQGELKGLKVGKQWRFNKADLVAYMERKPASLSQVAQSEADAELSALQGQLGQTISIAEDNSEESKITGIVNGLLSIAVENGASDLHFEPKAKGLLVRQRLDGVLHEIRTLPASLHLPIVNRLKTMGDMDINEKRLPQDGRIALKYKEKNLEARIASCPSAFGEAVTLRILDSSSVVPPFEKLGFDANDEAHLRKWITSPNGLVLITGPMGSGKTTVLYSCVAQVATPENKTVAIEDPVEFSLMHTTQTYVNNKAGLTFAAALHAFLRQDPDIIMVGELLDGETSQGALYAALTGHMVLSTMHTNSAASTLTRLLHLDIEPFLISAGLLGISNQRLVRRICPDCREEVKVDASLLKQTRERAAKGGYAVPKNTRFGRGRGCPKCRQTGYRGRVGIYELLDINDSIGNALMNRAGSEELNDLALQNGMTSLFADGTRKAVEGITTLDEVLRATGGR
jgi:excisionase family DNA binding protein